MGSPRTRVSWKDGAVRGRQVHCGQYLGQLGPFPFGLRVLYLHDLAQQWCDVPPKRGASLSITSFVDADFLGTDVFTDPNSWRGPFARLYINDTTEEGGYAHAFPESSPVRSAHRLCRYVTVHAQQPSTAPPLLNFAGSTVLSMGTTMTLP